MINKIIKLALKRKWAPKSMKDLPTARDYLNKLSTFVILRQLIKEYSK